MCELAVIVLAQLESICRDLFALLSEGMRPHLTVVPTRFK